MVTTPPVVRVLARTRSFAPDAATAAKPPSVTVNEQPVTVTRSAFIICRSVPLPETEKLLQVRTTSWTSCTSRQALEGSEIVRLALRVYWPLLTICPQE